MPTFSLQIMTVRKCAIRKASNRVTCLLSLALVGVNKHSTRVAKCYNAILILKNNKMFMFKIVIF